ncbi:cellulose synthase subunit BcsC-related outer membrane protein [Croceibacterium sp. TMG7-5b_MA50]|uniref:cellulose biosynthesis protein BcsC n=1 Tax=Croceibacterium sp. TMG7-5b_MA50 TaxID=3121290 RepID=UPI003221E2C2
MSRPLSRGLALLLGTGTLALTGVALPAPPAWAQAAGVEALLAQARYWRAQGREDRARDAYRRALQIDPNNAEARRGLAGGGRPAPTPAPRPAPAPAPARQGAAPRVANPAPAARPAPARPAPAPAQATPRPAARDVGGEQRAQGFRALEAGQLDRAADLFGQALARSRSDDEALGGLGIVRLRQGRFVEARDLLTRASTLGNAAQWADALRSARYYGGIEEARATLAAGNLQAAEAQAQELVRSGFDTPAPALLLLAEVYERQGRYADAADVLGQAGATPGEEAGQLQSRAARNRALAASRFGDDDAAEEAFLSGLMLDPADPWTRYEFGRWLIARGRVAEGESMIAALDGIGSPDALYAAALLQQELGRPVEAQRLIDRIPDNQRTALVRDLAGSLALDRQLDQARALAAQGQAAQAGATLRRLAADPAQASARPQIAQALLDVGDRAGAAEVARATLASGNPDAAGYETLVRVLSGAGAELEARGALAAARQRLDAGSAARLDGVLAVSQADRLRQDGQLAEAFDLLQQAWRANPGSTDVLFELGLLYEAGAMPAQGAQTFQLLLAREPDNVPALLGLARTAIAAGDNGLADDALRRAMAQAPEDYEVYLAAADLARARGDEGRAVRLLQQARMFYGRSHGVALGDLSADNPFASSALGNNPFRARAEVQTAAAINPFALDGGGTRLPAGGLSTAFPQGDAQTSASVTGDPVLARIDRDIRTLRNEAGPRVEVDAGFRDRSGEEGLSALSELKGTARISTDLGPGRIGLEAELVALDNGVPSRSGQARFGRNATAEAQAIVDQLPTPLALAPTQHAAGVAPTLFYVGDRFDARIGVTPLGFDHQEITGRLEARPRLSANGNLRAWVERRAVDDSVLSYAGTRDPVTGQLWGQVMQTGGGVSLGWDRDGSGVYGDVAYHQYRGREVADNHSIQGNVGGYLLLHQGARDRIVAGANFNYQSYDNNQNNFTFGHGGYFSPQTFLSVSFPIRYIRSGERFELELQAAPGYQSFDQDQVAIFPTDPAAQAQLDALKLLNTDVRSFYDGISETGLAFSGRGRLGYQVTPRTRIIGDMGYDTFGVYNEFTSTIGIRQQLGDGN